jgi:hypothetical protein
MEGEAFRLKKNLILRLLKNLILKEFDFSAVQILTLSKVRNNQ